MNFLDLARAVFGLAFTLGIIGLCAWAARRYAPQLMAGKAIELILLAIASSRLRR